MWDEKADSPTDLITKLFVKQPLALPRSANEYRIQETLNISMCMESSTDMKTNRNKQEQTKNIL